MKNKILISAFLIFSLSFIANAKLFAQAAPFYPLNTSHAAYTTGYSCGMGDDYARGFCFAFDAIQPVTIRLGVYVLKSIPSINYAGEEYNGLPWNQNLSMNLYMPEQLENEYDIAAEGVEQYAAQLYNAGLYDDSLFWQGYARLLRWAHANPLILNLTPGTSM